MTTRKPTVLLADDHAILLDSLKTLLSPEYDVVGTVTDGRTLVESASALSPDIVVTDIAMPGLNGLDALVQLRRRAPGARLIVLSMNEDADTASEAMRRGAAGYVAKAAAGPQLFEALRDVLAGRTYVSPGLAPTPAGAPATRGPGGPGRRPLSARQREVLQLLAEGRSMKEAADALGLTPRTIAFHKYSMMEQLGLKTSAELIRYALVLGLVPGGPPGDLV